MIRSKFLAGLIATLIALIFVTGIAILLVLVFDVEPTKNGFTIAAAFLTIGVWSGLYKWLKPKDQTPLQQDQYKDGELPPRHS